MLRIFSWLAAVLLASAGAASADIPAGAAPAAVPEADALLDQVVARLPTEPLQIGGELRSDPRGGKPGRRCQVQLRLEYGANPPFARYTIMDAFGEDLEQITLFRPRQAAVSWHYARGYPLKDAPLPDPRLPVQGTDLTWSDLSLSFLWWRNARLTGLESVLDRECYEIEAPAPAGEPAPYAAVRMWIDRKYLMLVRAEGLDPAGRPIRRIAVKSIKKIDEEWMVKDLEITSLPEKTRTILQINLVDKPEVEAAPR
jgi:hypothetical protein